MSCQIQLRKIYSEIPKYISVSLAISEECLNFISKILAVGADFAREAKLKRRLNGCEIEPPTNPFLVKSLKGRTRSLQAESLTKRERSERKKGLVGGMRQRSPDSQKLCKLKRSNTLPDMTRSYLAV